MVRKAFGIVIALVLAMTCVMPAYAADVTAIDSGIAPMSVTTASSTVTDSAGNKYFVTGVSYRGGDNCETTTSFETTYYREGTVTAKKELDAREKTLTASGNVTMWNFASTTYSGSRNVAGATGSYTAFSDTLLYYPILVSGYSSFSFNGASWSGNSSDSLI